MAGRRTGADPALWLPPCRHLPSTVIPANAGIHLRAMLPRLAPGCLREPGSQLSLGRRRGRIGHRSIAPSPFIVALSTPPFPPSPLSPRHRHSLHHRCLPSTVIPANAGIHLRVMLPGLALGCLREYGSHLSLGRRRGQVITPSPHLPSSSSSRHRRFVRHRHLPNTVIPANAGIHLRVILPGPAPGGLLEPASRHSPGRRSGTIRGNKEKAVSRALA